MEGLPTVLGFLRDARAEAENLGEDWLDVFCRKVRSARERSVDGFIDGKKPKAAIANEVFLAAYKANFDTLSTAIQRGCAILVECFDSRMQEKVAVVAAVNREGEDGLEMVPLARMLDGNPYEYIQPPAQDGGFSPL